MDDSLMNPQPLGLSPQYREYVWGGARLRPQIVPTAEAWVIYADDLVSAGPYAGRSLASLAAQFGEQLLGARALAHTGSRFPLLAKILDCADWLSLQVHPNDQQAAALEGPGFFGKTEAWHILEAAPGAKLIAGIQPGVSAETLTAAIRAGSLLNSTQSLQVRAGDTLLIHPGAIHALGPGLLVYEIQQTSDLTYRVYDWDRPSSQARPLHIEKALAVSRATARVAALPAPQLADGEARIVSQSDYFTLELLSAAQTDVQAHTLGQSFHAITVIEGRVQICAHGLNHELGKFESVLIPAACGAYQIKPLQAARLLRASV